MKPYLSTARIEMYELTRNDNDKIMDLDSDPEVMRYLSNGVPSSPEEVQRVILHVTNLLEKHQGRFGFWAAIEKSSGEFMGWFHFRPGKKDQENTKRIELGYRLKRKFWRQGYATEGSLALIKKGFTELGVEEVFAVTMKTNLGSQRVMQKAGLTYVKDFQDDHYPPPLNEQVEYSLTKEAWSNT